MELPQIAFVRGNPCHLWLIKILNKEKNSNFQEARSVRIDDFCLYQTRKYHDYKNEPREHLCAQPGQCT